jgi:hypothetical protein
MRVPCSSISTGSIVDRAINVTREAAPVAQ